MWTTYKKMPRPIKNEREMEPKKFSNDLKNKLMKGTIKIYYTSKNVSTKENTSKQSLLSQILRTNVVAIVLNYLLEYFIFVAI